MEFTITALLAVFVLLMVASGVFFVAKRFHLPYTVLLVATGLCILYPLTYLPFFSFLQDFSLSPELLFYILLPVLIFESAYNIEIRRLSENVVTVTALAVFGLLISAFAIASALFLILPYAGVPIPFSLCLLFGALISATDPVAVLSLFKEVGAPRRLTLLFEGESIFNDGTAVALFFVVLGIVQFGFDGMTTVWSGIASFVIMVLGGIGVGLFVGFLFSRILGYARSNEFVQITLMLVMAHITFIGTDLVSEHAVIFGFPIQISAIIATAVASLVLGNYGRPKISPDAEEFIEKFWAQTAFVSNSLVFILLGLIFATLPIRIVDLIIPITLTVLIVALARALSIYPLVHFVNSLNVEEPVSRAWQHILAWGSLRGALAITMVLFIPTDLSFPNWTLPYTPYECILGLTIGCIFATLFLKATTIKWLMQKNGLQGHLQIEALELDESRALMHERVLERLDQLCTQGHMSIEQVDALREEHEHQLSLSRQDCARDLGENESDSLGERILRMYTIGIERQQLRQLYISGEVNERVYRAILEKLHAQYDLCDRPTLAHTRKLRCVWCSRVFKWVQKMIAPEYCTLSIADAYLYYRTNTVLSQTVLNTLKRMERKKTGTIFGTHAFQHVREIYAHYLTGSRKKMQLTYEQAPHACATVALRTARHSVLRIEESTLRELSERKMITPKIQAVLRHEIETEADKMQERQGYISTV